MKLSMFFWVGLLLGFSVIGLEGNKRVVPAPVWLKCSQVLLESAACTAATFAGFYFASGEWKKGGLYCLIPFCCGAIGEILESMFFNQKLKGVLERAFKEEVFDAIATNPHGEDVLTVEFLDKAVKGAIEKSVKDAAVRLSVWRRLAELVRVGSGITLICAPIGVAWGALFHRYQNREVLARILGGMGLQFFGLFPIILLSSVVSGEFQ